MSPDEPPLDDDQIRTNHCRVMTETEKKGNKGIINL